MPRSRQQHKLAQRIPERQLRRLELIVSRRLDGLLNGEHIGLLPRLVGGMADLIDHDHRSPSHYEAIGNAAGVAAARAAAEGTVAGRLWDDDGAALLAAGYAFHTGLSR